MSKKIPTRQLGKNGPFVSAIGFGSGVFGDFYGAKTDREEAMNVLSHAADRGMTFWDCADIYRDAELILGRWFEQTGRRSEIFLSTKFGGGDPVTASFKPISTPSYIRKSVARSLERLKTDYIDLYYQHRVDPGVPIEVVLETLKEFVDKGQIKWIGLSECSVDVLRRARAVPGIGEKVIAAQMEYSPFALDIEGDFINTSRELGIAIVAYSPLGRGMMSGKLLSPAEIPAGDLRQSIPYLSEKHFKNNLFIVSKFQEIAKRYNASSAQITLAWILSEHSDFIPIPGCRSVSRIEENAGGADIQLSPEDLTSVREALNTAADKGLRKSEAALASCMIDCIPLSEWNGE